MSGIGGTIMPIELPDFFPGSDKTEFVAIWANEDVNDHHTRIANWCIEQNINSEFIGMWMVADGTNQCSLWKIDDPQERTIFRLKWAWYGSHSA